MATPTTNYNLLKPAVGEPYDVTLINNNYDKIDAQLAVEAAGIKKSAKILAVAGTVMTWGTSPSAAITGGTADMQELFGSLVLTSDASGYAGVDMTGSFSNGYDAISVINGDVAAQTNITFPLSTGIFTNINSRFYVKFVNPATGAAIPNTTARLNFIAKGW